MSDIIATRRHPKLAAKDAIYKLLSDSYKGGFQYIEGAHLTQHDREYTTAYQKRLKRSVFANYVQPIVDLLTGFIFKHEPERKYPDSLSYLQARASKKKSLDAFMQAVCTFSLMHTTGILVDSPSFEPEMYPTQAARQSAGLNPYACIYTPMQIRDFACDDQMNLEWVWLDDSRVIKTDPMSKPEHKKIYRLWTKTYFQDFEIKEEATGKTVVIASDKMAHPVGYVPFHFVNGRDVEDDYISDSPFEDVAILNRLDYSILSYLEEMLASGTFKTLFFPYMNKDEIPDEIKKKGLADSPLVGFNGQMSQKPYFDGAGLQEITPYKEARQMIALEIFRKVGMDVDRDKRYVQSGTALGKEFEKTEALLISEANALSEAEEFIFRTAAKWDGVTLSDSDVEIKYSKKFQGDDINDRLVKLYKLYNTGEPSVRQKSLEGIIEITLPGEDAEKLAAETMERGPDFPLEIDRSTTQEAAT